MTTASLLRRTGLIALAVPLAIAACDGPRDGVSDNDPTSPAFSRAAEIDAAQPVLDFATLSAVGTSKLVRTADGVSYRLSTSGLEPGNAYTLWFVVFNDPAGCLTP
ncbi:MAG: hypothetical protein R3266_06000, partial [Gemmatimonadota bacterium]|nr:hypothetical protein [Gemmatimonadota bacterium]